MKLRHHDLLIPEDGSDPFVNCKLDRKKYADVLINIVDDYADGFVLAINNPWGEGKTTFVKMWRQHLINEGFPTLYFNAWENDFQQDVLVALISELSELKNKPEKQFKDVLKKVVPLTGKLIPKIFKHLIKRYGGDEAAQDILESVGEYTEDQLKELTDSYKEKKESVKKFRDSLQAFANEAGGDKPLIFIIDELDRCRPNYAVEILEQIKHLFSVPGIVFVLSIDKVQLGHAVRGVYGSNKIDANEYLRRFIDLEYSIPEPDIGLYVHHLLDYFGIDQFFKDEERLKHSVFKNDRANFIGFSKILFFQKKMTLRQIEKLYAKTKITLTFFEYNSYVFPTFFLTLIFIHSERKEIYLKIKHKEYNLQELTDAIDGLFAENLNRDEHNSISYMFALFLKLYFNFLSYNEPDHIELFDNDPETKEPKLSITTRLNKINERGQNSLVEAIQFYERFYNYDLRSLKIDHFLNKVELLSPISN